MSPRDWVALVGWTCLTITALIILFSFTRSPYEIIEGIVKWVPSLRKTKKSKPVQGRHHVQGDEDGRDGEEGQEVADSPSGDSAHPDDAKEAA